MIARPTAGRGRWRQLTEEGVAAIEFAFVLPVFLLFVLGTIEFAQAFQMWNTMLLAVEEGARYAMVYSPPNTLPAGCGNLAQCVQTRAKSQLPGINANKITIPVPTTTAGAPSTMTITATATFNFVAANFLPFGPIVLQRQVTIPLTD